MKIGFLQIILVAFFVFLLFGNFSYLQTNLKKNVNKIFESYKNILKNKQE